MKSAKTLRFFAVVVALFAFSHPIVSLVCDLGAYASPESVGVSINAASGQVVSVDPRSDAAAAGLRAGDRVDFSRTGPLMHLWLWDSFFPVGRPVALPIVRNRQHTAAIVVASAPPLNTGALTDDVLTLLAAIVLMTLACAAVFARVDTLTLAFYAFCIFYAMSDNTALLRISHPFATPLTALESALPVLAGNLGFLLLCLRFPTGSAVGSWRKIDAAVVPFACLVGLLYYLHFYQSAFVTGTTSSLYTIVSVLSVAGSIVGLTAYVSRFWGARGPEVTRMRWVAAAIAVYIAANTIFFVDQTVNRDATPWVIWLFKYNPAPYAFAYALVQGHVVDIRIAGGRAVIYALITSIPVALLAFADWLFARRLEDARLATVFEIAIALGFSFWLRTLHRRIDRIAERVFFASRHRAFQRIHHLIQALPFTEKVETVESLLVEEAPSAMRFFSAALFRADRGVYVRTASAAWDGGAQTLDQDDPIVLYARSANHGVHLIDTPPSKAMLPGGDPKPVYALPIVVGRGVIALVLYGAHRDGESIDSEEEQLLTGLAHAAATAYEHLHAVEREREIAMLNAKLSELQGHAMASQ